MPVLRRHVKRGDSLAVRRSSKRRFLIDIRAVVQQPSHGFRATAKRGPNERRASIRIGVHAGACPNQTFQHTHAIALAGPNERFVEKLLRIVGRLPFGKPAVRTIEAPGGTSLSSERAIGVETRVHEVRHTESGRHAEIAWGGRMLPQQFRCLAMPPKQGDDERGTARPASFCVRSRAMLQQQRRDVRPVGIGGCVERRPSMNVALIYVSPCGQQ